MIFFSHKCGQLGNRLFAFAHLIAFAHANGYKVANLAFEEYAPFFETTNQDAFCRFPTTRSLLRSSKIRFILFTINRVVLKALRILNITQSNLHSVVIADLPEYAFEEWRFYQLDTPAFKKLANKKFAFLFGRFFRDFENLQKLKFNLPVSSRLKFNIIAIILKSIITTSNLISLLVSIILLY